MRCFSVIMCCVALLAGCASNKDDGRANMPVTGSPEMSIDPVSMPELPQWFSNVELTIAFRPDGNYRIYKGLNHHAKPIESGRWIRHNYITVRLEPYAVGRAAAPVRATLFRDSDEDGTLMLQLPDARIAPLRSLAGPPKIEDNEA